MFNFCAHVLQKSNLSQVQLLQSSGPSGQSQVHRFRFSEAQALHTICDLCSHQESKTVVTGLEDGRYGDVWGVYGCIPCIPQTWTLKTLGSSGISWSPRYPKIEILGYLGYLGYLIKQWISRYLGLRGQWLFSAQTVQMVPLRQFLQMSLRQQPIC